MHLDSCYCPTCRPEEYEKMKSGPNMNNPMNHEYRYDPIKEKPPVSENLENYGRGPAIDYTEEVKKENANKYADMQGFKASQETKQTIRVQILDTAKKLTTGDRDKSYGPPIDNLTTYANLCTAYIFGKDGNKNDLFALDAVDAAVLMILSKVSRIAANRGHKDNYVDGAAYMAIAGECDELLERAKDDV